MIEDVKRKCTKCGAHIHEACMDEHELQAKGEFCKPKHKELIFCPELIEKLVARSPSAPSNYRPLLVFINSKSGGQQGNALFSKLRSLLTAEQVVDLLGDPKNGFILFSSRSSLLFSIFSSLLDLLDLLDLLFSISVHRVSPMSLF